jgi:hypothetical protein
MEKERVLPGKSLAHIHDERGNKKRILRIQGKG